MKSDTERMPIIMRRTAKGLEPVSAFDAECLDKIAIGSDVEITIKKRRSLPQLRLYWQGLTRLVEATDCFPSADHCHDAIKLDLGYVTPVRRFDGKVQFLPDSVAIGKMDAIQFNAFFERARKRIIETFGCDPWEAQADPSQARVA